MLEPLKKHEHIAKALEPLKKALSTKNIAISKDLGSFVFLCGANKAQDQISERRKALIAFSKKNLTDTHFFLAERAFGVLEKEGHSENILDIESRISEFADYILIILESYSSFAELGAFSNSPLRSKIVVINDKKYIAEKSFINMGPLKAITETQKKGESKVISYHMKPNGIHEPDGIGEIYSDLAKIFGKSQPKRALGFLSPETANPALKLDKTTACFLHDIIYFTGPISYKELIELLKHLFPGKFDFKIKDHIAMLSAFDAISRSENGNYRSKLRKTYYEYRIDTFRLMGFFRTITQKYENNRFYEH